jgi:hypothetical protein
MIRSTAQQLVQSPGTLSMPDFASGHSRPGDDVDELLVYAEDALSPLATQLAVIAIGHPHVWGTAATTITSTCGTLQPTPSILSPTVQSAIPSLALRDRLVEIIAKLGSVDDQVRYERDRQHVDQDRLANLRQARAHESTDLYHWYEQKEE